MACNSVRVLLVEDDIVIQELVEATLEDGSFTIVKASNGEEAIATLSSEDFECQALITDINLGSDTTGWAVAKRARELDDSVPVVYITGGNGHEWASNGVPNSILICKPFAPAQIVTAVAQLLNTCERQ